MGKSKSELIDELNALVLSGGNRTTAANVRTLITDLINAYDDAVTFLTGIVAYAAGGQLSATQLTKKYNRVDTAASSGASVLLLPATAGTEQYIQNTGANDINIFPRSGENFYGQAANASFNVVAGQQIKVFCFTDGEWTLI